MAVDRSRKTVLKEVTELYIGHTTAKELMETLEGIIAKYGEDAVIENERSRYDDSTYIAIKVHRPESDKEMTKRIAYEEQWDKVREENERQEFERLKAKFTG